MKKATVGGVVCLIMLLVSNTSVGVELCPEPGAGEGIISIFEEACVDCDRGPVDTCGQEFSLTLVDVAPGPAPKLIVFTYDVYKYPDAEEGTDLAHWVLGVDLAQFQQYLGDGMALSDIFVDCAGAGCLIAIPDARTQLDGVKFEGVVGDGETQTFTLTLDEGALIPGWGFGEGCMLAATRADNEDIRWANRPAPGYVCISGPVLVEKPIVYVCPKSMGYWKNHLSKWPVSSLTLGCQEYPQEELLTILKTPPRGDASVILARQLAAAKLNIERGSDPEPASGAIEAADELFCEYSGKLPYRVRTYTYKGKQMLKLARILDMYNNGWLTDGCGDED